MPIITAANALCSLRESLTAADAALLRVPPQIQSAKDINFFGFFTPPHVDLDSNVSFAKLSETPVGSKVVVSPSRITEGAGEFIATAEGHFTLVRAVVVLAV